MNEGDRMTLVDSRRPIPEPTPRCEGSNRPSMFFNMASELPYNEPEQNPENNSYCGSSQNNNNSSNDNKLSPIWGKHSIAGVTGKEFPEFPHQTDILLPVAI